MRQKKLVVITGLLAGSLAAAGIAPLFAEDASTPAAPAASAPPATVASPGTAPAPVVNPPAVSSIPPAPTSTALPDLPNLIKQSSAAVVNISVDGKATLHSMAAPDLPPGLRLPPPFDNMLRKLPDYEQDQPVHAFGSGFIISPDGYIVTNSHVVEGASTITVTLNDKREVKADVVGIDKLSDIALLKVNANNLPTVQFGDSNQLEVGQWVYAIGAPFGLDHTATQGIVSALSRSLPDGTYVPFIQTDVAVNPGNSGGPLFDLSGRVIGVNSQIYSRSGGYMGISFAIPINLTKNVIEQLKSNGQVSRGWLGVEIQDMDQQLASSFQLKKPSGALVASVQADSPAAKAGLQAGDIITGFGQWPVGSASDLPLLVGNTSIGKQMPVKILRTGKEQVINVTIDKLADNTGQGTKLAASKAGNGEAALGIEVANLSDEERQDAKLQDKGVIVRGILDDSPAETAGLETGDIIVSVNNQIIRSVEDLQTIVKNAPDDRPLAMLIMHDDSTRFIAISKSKPTS